MKSDEIKNLFTQFEAVASEFEGIECWSAPELQELLGYSKWENFEKVIIKAKAVCRTAGELVENHFPDVRKMVEIGSKSERPIDN
jgi:DNA-damage-inducible protein D